MAGGFFFRNLKSKSFRAVQPKTSACTAQGPATVAAAAAHYRITYDACPATNVKTALL